MRRYLNSDATSRHEVQVGASAKAGLRVPASDAAGAEVSGSEWCCSQ